ncbi:MAG: tol-pal system protein YbgF [Alphaproteobacteria bacterium]
MKKINPRKARLALGLSLVCTGALIAPALAQNYDPYDAGQSQVFSAGDAASAEVRIQQFESQISVLTGKIEEQDYKLKQLQDQLEKLTGDLAMRVGDLEKGGGGGYGATPPSTPPADRGILDNTDSTSMNSGGGYQWDSTRPGESRISEPLGTLTESGSGDSAAVQYENAFAALKSGDYAAAEGGFKSFIAANPTHVLAGNAKYWLGETYYVRGDFENAARIFAEAFQQYPKSSKAPDNLLKLGMSLASLNKKDDACIALGQIEAQYASGAGPVLNRAKQEMSRLGC